MNPGERPAITIADMQDGEQDEVRALILWGLADHWEVIDPSLNPDLVDIRRSYAAGRTVVAHLDEVVAATGTVIPRDQGVAEIVRMSVRNTDRRTGVGSLILRELVLTARAWGATKIVLETTAHWHGVVAFYQANGFSISHHSSSPYGQEAWLEMEL